MAFVSKSCIEEWFTTDSWVYKNFSYMFKNPLWDKNVPRGFSLCPYFWIAMFSMCVFRPILVPVIMGFRRVIHTGFKPIGALDAWVLKVMGMEHIPGVGLLIPTVLGMTLFIAGGAAWICVLLYQKFILGNFSATALFWYAALNGVAVLVTGIYGYRHRRDRNPCQVQWYALSIGVASTVALYNTVPEVMALATHRWGIVCQLIAHVLYGAIVFAGHGIAIVAAFVATKLCWLAGLLVAGVMSMVIPVPLLGWLVAMTVLAGIIGKLMPYSQPTEVTTKVSPSDWRDFIAARFHTVDCPHAVNTELGRWLRELPVEYADYQYGAVRSMALRITVRAMLDDLDIPAGWRNVGRRAHGLCLADIPSWDEYVDVMASARYILCVDAVKVDPELASKVRSVFESTTRAAYMREVDYLRVLDAAAAERKARRYKRRARASRCCHALSDPLAWFFEHVGLGLKAVFWTCLLVAPWRVLRWLFRFVKIFTVYMWVVIKHAKHGACPYMSFKEPEPKH